MVRIAILSLSALIWLAGCTTVSHTPLSRDASSQLQGRSVSVTRYPMPDFAAFTAGKAAFALVGAAAMVVEGNSIVKDNEIPDPAIEIGRVLAERLGSSRSMRWVEPTRVSTSDDIPTLVSASPGADYLVDVKTFNWLFNYYPSDWSHYRVTYNARVRLIDTARKAVVAETLCRAVQGDDANPPSKEQLLDKRAQLLKEYLAQAAAGCGEVLTRDLLQL
jgi:hypothetical protein